MLDLELTNLALILTGKYQRATKRVQNIERYCKHLSKALKDIGMRNWDL